MRFNSHPRNQEEGSKKMHPRKPEIFSGFLLFSPFFSLFQKSKNNADKKMQNAFKGCRWGLEPQTSLFWGVLATLFRDFPQFFLILFVNFLCLPFLMLYEGLNNLKELVVDNGRYILRSCNEDKESYPDIYPRDLKIQGVAVCVMQRLKKRR